MTQVADPNSDFKLAEQKKEITNQIESLPKPSPERRKRPLGSSRRAVPRQLQGVLDCGLLHDLRQAAQPDTNLFNRTVPDTCREIHGYIGDFKLGEWWFSTSSLITSAFRVASDECTVSRKTDSLYRRKLREQSMLHVKGYLGTKDS